MYYECHLSSCITQKVFILLLLIFGVVIAIGSLGVPSPNIFSSSKKLIPLSVSKKGNEVFGFVPYWTLGNLQNVDFHILTTLAYFSVDVGQDGSLDTHGPGYTNFESQNATDLFKKAHENGTRVVLTLTQMDNRQITSFLDNSSAQGNAISQIVSLVKDRGIDGVNIDFEYIGDPGNTYRSEFTSFTKKLSDAMHRAVPSSYVTVSVLASSVKDPKLYAIHDLSLVTDGIFMMAYDFATTSSDTAMPTAPLHGYQDGTYWYDVATAVGDFLTQMPSSKLILGVPWYAYNYPVYSPGTNVPTRPSSWRISPMSQTYEIATNEIPSQVSGWDNEGDVGWKAYYDSSSYTWRIVFIEDARSLGMKYDFAKQKGLLGIGIWALGFDSGSQDMWNLLEQKFGEKIADSNVINREISE